MKILKKGDTVYKVYTASGSNHKWGIHNEMHRLDRDNIPVLSDIHNKVGVSFTCNLVVRKDVVVSHGYKKTVLANFLDRCGFKIESSAVWDWANVPISSYLASLDYTPFVFVLPGGVVAPQAIKDMGLALQNRRFTSLQSAMPGSNFAPAIAIQWANGKTEQIANIKGDDIFLLDGTAQVNPGTGLIKSKGILDDQFAKDLSDVEIDQVFSNRAENALIRVIKEGTK